MILIKLKKAEATLSKFLLASILCQLFYPTVSFSRNFSTSSVPVASPLSGLVDGYTGDFNYSVPLLSVPGPNGESVPITASYHAGIGVNQKASWIGLGWDYNPGEISRSIIGSPDDYNGRLQYSHNTTLDYGAPTVNSNLTYGAIYNNQINTINAYAAGLVTNFQYPLTKNSDYYTIYRNLPEIERRNMFFRSQMGTDYYNTSGQFYQGNDNYRFRRTLIPYQALAYDDYSVSGGISGQLKPVSCNKNYLYSNHSLGTNNLPVSNKAFQFYFSNSSNQNITASTSSLSTHINQSTNRVHSGVFVRYFTNAEINNNANLFNYNSSKVGFIDYRTVSSGSRRPSPEFDPDGIGGFQITDASGVTYHYSLPVYNFLDESYQTEFNPNLQPFTASGNDYVASTSFIRSYKKEKYAVSWKLTAITGVDYQDVNNNYTVDEGDKGYWIKYNYSLWSNDYEYASQRYDCKIDGSIAKTRDEHFNRIVYKPNVYKKSYNKYSGHTQVYYLNYIQTASHTAFFVKSVRFDEQSYDNIRNPSTLPTALLKLDKIVLLDNKDKGLLINTIQMSSADKDARFNYSTSNAALTDQNFTHITKYNQNKLSIDDVALKTIDFNTDYSLCRKYTSNINTVVTSGEVTVNQDIQGLTSRFICRKIKTISVPSNLYEQSGKLTLKKILFYDLKGIKITPAIDFDYETDNSNKNPDFDQDKTDLWGYYKKDYVNSHFVTDVSKDNVDAWSLRTINTALGGKIKVEYESDVYHKEGFSDDPDFIPVPNVNLGSPYNTNPISENYLPYKTTMPHLVFPINTVNLSTGAGTMFDMDYYPFSMYMGTRDASEPIKVKSALILNFKDYCLRPVVYYNNGNSMIPWTRTIEKIVHRGTSNVGYASATAMSVYSGPQFYSSNATLFTGVGTNALAEDLNLSAGYCSTLNQQFGSNLSNGAMNFIAYFRNHLFGGGLRVKKITVEEPNRNEKYYQEFSYGKGYCPVVPKSLSLCYASPYGNYDVSGNYKSLISSQLNNRIGYDFIKTKTVNENGDNLGYTITNFENNIIANPLQFNQEHLPSIARNVVNPQINPYAYFTPLAGYCHYNPVPSLPYIFNYTYGFAMILDKGGYDLGLNLSTYAYDNNDKILTYTINNYKKGSYIEENNGYVNYNKLPGNSSNPNLEEYNTTTTAVCVSSNPVTQPNSQVLFSVRSYDIYSYFYNTRYYNSPILVSTTNYRDGITSSGEVLTKDNVTGLVESSSSFDNTIGTVKSYISYAYKNSEYTAMGLKTINELNTNQLTSTLESKTVKEGYVISHIKNTYTNQYPTREYDVLNNSYKTSSYSKNGYRLDETFTRLLDDNIPENTTPSSIYWRKLSKTNLFDSKGIALESEGLNSRRVAVKFGYNNRYQLASVSNAGYESFTFSGFEDNIVSGSATHYGGEITRGDGRISSATALYNGAALLVKPHTGKFFTRVNSGIGPMFKSTNMDLGRTYVAKVWVHKSCSNLAALNISLSGTKGAQNTPVNIINSVNKTDSKSVPVGDWILLTTEVDVPVDFNLSPSNYLSVYLSNTATTAAYFDDLAFSPKDSPIVGNIYDETTGLLLAQLDAENFATIYNYDSGGRITTTFKEYSGGIKKISDTDYHYAKP